MMSIQPMSHQQATTLAAFVHTLRPDWDVPGIVAALGQVRDRAVAGEVAVAAIRAATDHGNRTPAVIAMDGKHWRGGDPTSRTVNTGVGKCGSCGTYHTADAPHAAPATRDSEVKRVALAEMRRLLPPSKDKRTNA
jgi:hypothetical protein